VEYALDLVIAADPLEKYLRQKGLQKRYDQETGAWLDALVAEGELSREQADLLLTTEAAVRNVIDVDDFPKDGSAEKK
jgi:hypothetical protein